MEKPPTVRDFVDRVIRESLRHPEHLKGLLQLVVPELADRFDYQQARLADREFPLDDWRRREADLPFEIPCRLGDETVSALVLVLIEHQSDTDPLMPFRTLYYAVGYWDRQWRAWEMQAGKKPSFRLRPVLPIVFYTGSTAWGSNRTLADLLGEPADLHPFAPTWQPLFWNLAEQPPETLLAADNAWVQSLAVLRADRADEEHFRAVLVEVVERLRTLFATDHVRWYDLMRSVLTWALSRRSEAEHPALLQAVTQTQKEAEVTKEIETMAQKLGPTLVERARAEGMVLANRKTLKKQLLEKFGTLPQDVSERIDALNDNDHLEQLLIQVINIKDLQELQL